MSYDSLETGNGNPVELYEFRYGTQVIRSTSADEDKAPSTASGSVYTSEYIQRTDIEQTQELNRSNVIITLHKDHVIAALYKGRPPDQVVTVTISRYHEENVAEEDVAVIWPDGRVLSCIFSGQQAELTVESVVVSQRQLGLSRMYSKNCPYQLFDGNCAALSSLYLLNTTVNAISDTAVTVNGASAKADGYYAGGYVTWLDDNGNQRARSIYDHTGDVLTLDWAIDGLAVSDAIMVYPGCAHNLADCNDKFSNTDNYGGFPFIPEKDPFDTVVY